MKTKMIASLLTLTMAFGTMTPTFAKSWDCSTGTCVETNKPCGQLEACIGDDCTDKTCTDASCENSKQSGWMKKLIAALAAIGITAVILDKTAE